MDKLPLLVPDPAAVTAVSDRFAAVQAEPAGGIASADQRIVLPTRYHGCTRPGCTCAGADWADDGQTNIDDLILACPTDDRSVKPGGWPTRKRHDGGTSMRQCRQSTFRVGVAPRSGRVYSLTPSSTVVGGGIRGYHPHTWTAVNEESTFTTTRNYLLPDDNEFTGD